MEIIAVDWKPYTGLAKADYYINCESLKKEAFNLDAKWEKKFQIKKTQYLNNFMREHFTSL